LAWIEHAAEPVDGELQLRIVELKLDGVDRAPGFGLAFDSLLLSVRQFARLAFVGRLDGKHPDDVSTPPEDRRRRSVEAATAQERCLVAELGLPRLPRAETGGVLGEIPTRAKAPSRTVGASEDVRRARNAGRPLGNRPDALEFDHAGLRPLFQEQRIEFRVVSLSRQRGAARGVIAFLVAARQIGRA